MIMCRLLPLLLLFTTITFAEELSVKPGINDKFLEPSLKVEEWTEKFETESREIFHFSAASKARKAFKIRSRRALVFSCSRFCST